jgi:hypothetical protein
MKFGKFIFDRDTVDLSLLKKGDAVISTNSFARDHLYTVRIDGQLPLGGTQRFQLDERHPIYAA